jgi:hypothetical protein
VPVFDELVLTGFLLIQALAERHNFPFSIVIPVVVGSNPISHPTLLEAMEGERTCRLGARVLPRF